MIPDLHDALFDSWLLEQFPGRTLEELDTINIFRYLKAMEARGLETLEKTRKEVMKKDSKLKASDLPKGEWERIKEYDDLEKEYIRRKGQWQT